MSNELFSYLEILQMRNPTHEGKYNHDDESDYSSYDDGGFELILDREYYPEITSEELYFIDKILYKISFLINRIRCEETASYYGYKDQPEIIINKDINGLRCTHNHEDDIFGKTLRHYEDPKDYNPKNYEKETNEIYKKVIKIKLDSYIIGYEEIPDVRKGIYLEKRHPTNGWGKRYKETKDTLREQTKTKGAIVIYKIKQNPENLKFIVLENGDIVCERRYYAYMDDIKNEVCEDIEYLVKKIKELKVADIDINYDHDVSDEPTDSSDSESDSGDLNKGPGKMAQNAPIFPGPNKDFHKVIDISEPWN